MSCCVSLVARNAAARRFRRPSQPSPDAVGWRCFGGARRRRVNPTTFRTRKRQEKKKMMELVETESNHSNGIITPANELRPATEPPLPLSPTVDAATATEASATAPFWRRWILPVRYRSTGVDGDNHYTRQHAVAVAWRVPLWLLLAALAGSDHTNPYGTVRITGPSMLPTCAPDGSEVWLASAWHRTVWGRALRWLGATAGPTVRAGDLVGLRHPDHPRHVSCKRVVGVAGDEVQRYGAYVHLFEEQDPVDLGMTWPARNDRMHDWIDRQCPWDTAADPAQRSTAKSKGEASRKLVVPENTVWVEGDCPGLAIDSRQYGPVPLKWIQGKLIARLWPFWRKEGELPYHVRPHPIPLDDHTLKQHNVHRIVTADTAA